MSLSNKLIAALTVTAAATGLWAGSVGAIEPLDDPIIYGPLVRSERPIPAPVGIEPLDDPLAGTYS